MASAPSSMVFLALWLSILNKENPLSLCPHRVIYYRPVVTGV